MRRALRALCVWLTLFACLFVCGVPSAAAAVPAGITAYADAKGAGKSAGQQVSAPQGSGTSAGNALTAKGGSKPAQITYCALSSASKVKIRAEIADRSSFEDGRCYLFALPLSKSRITDQSRPVQSKVCADKVTFTLPLNRTKSSSLLCSHFVIASRGADGAYTAVSNTMYLSNPGKAAKYTYRFPVANSKKGLQVSASMLEDAVELNVRHSVLNIVFTELIASAPERNKAASIPYQYHGKTFWFRRSLVESYDRQLTALKESKTLVSAVLLLGWRDDLSYLIYPSGRVKGHAFYAWNTSGAAAREQLQATLAFLAERYASSSSKHGRIVNWIVGNEVNNYKVYNYAGEKTLPQYARIYADAFRLTYNTVTSVYSNARVYISLDHLWNTNWVSGTFSSRSMLDTFAKVISRQGQIRWNLAYHPYSSPLTEPKFWENTNGQLTEALSTPVINMGNLSVLTSYIRKKYGSGTRIILSEQGYTSVQSGRNVGKEQTAAIVYSYYLAEADDMIDAFIMNRHVDHDVEVDQGLNLGLWTTTGGANPEWADEKKDSWKVFKYMDTGKSKSVAAPALKVIGAESWSEVVDGYSAKLYRKTDLTTAKLKYVKGYTKKASVPAKWKRWGAAATLSKTKNGLRVLRDGSRNRNSLWGFSQTVSKGLSFRKAPVFCTTLKSGNVQGSRVLVKLRFCSKDKILECERSVPANKTVRLVVSLGKWKYRGKVTRIQILLAPDGGSWGTGAYFELLDAARAVK